MICKNCKLKIPDSAAACPYCGEATASSPVTVTPASGSAFRPAGDLGSRPRPTAWPPAAPAASVAPVAPVASVAPVTPVAPVAPIAPVAPVTPVASVASVASVAPVHGISIGERVMQLLKSVSAGSVFLVAAIAFSCSVLFSLLETFSASNSMNSAMEEYGLDAIDGISQVMDGFMRGSIAIAIIAMIPSVLICIGLWMIYASATDRADPSRADSGLSVIKVVNLLKWVFMDIGLGIVLLLVITGASDVADYDGMGSAVAVIILILIGLIALVNLYYYKINQTVLALKQMVRTGEPSDQLSRFIGVMCYISGCLTGISAILALVDGNILSFLSSAGSTTAMICFGMLIFTLREKIQSLTASSSPYAPGWK